MFNSLRLSWFVLLCTFFFANIAQASEVHTVLDRLIHTYGGESNLGKMDKMIQKWDFVAMMGKRHGTDTRNIHAPNQLRVELSYPEKSETRILNGDSAHVIFEDRAAEDVSGIQRDAMRLQLMRLYSPLMLRTKIDSMSLIEEGDHLALLLVENGVHVYYLVNKENWHIEKVAGTLLMDGREIQFLTEYSDFAVVEGVLVHHKENKFAGGVNTAMLQLREITFDAELDDSRFKP